jgi:hypothetical protein
MLTLEQQVVSLELAQKLKELGVKQESLFYWFDPIAEQPVVARSNEEAVLKTFFPQKKYSAFTVAELGELLPKEITSDQLNKRFPYIANREAVHKDDDAMIEAEEAITEDFQSVFDTEMYEGQYVDGFVDSIKLDYSTGKEIRYHWVTDDWELNYEVFSVTGDTEANCRAKMLIYLLENKLI